MPIYRRGRIFFLCVCVLFQTCINSREKLKSSTSKQAAANLLTSCYSRTCLWTTPESRALITVALFAGCDALYVTSMMANWTCSPSLPQHSITIIMRLNTMSGRDSLLGLSLMRRYRRMMDVAERGSRGPKTALLSLLKIFF